MFQRDAELRPVNKTVVFDALAAAGITIVVVAFDGYGDSGQIENVEAKSGEDLVALPSGDVEIASAVWGQADPERTAMTVHDAAMTRISSLARSKVCGVSISPEKKTSFSFIATKPGSTIAVSARRRSSFTTIAFVSARKNLCSTPSIAFPALCASSRFRVKQWAAAI